MFTLRLLTTFAGVALALAALGLFGVLSYGVRLRSREFGIRMALGADRGSIRRMVMREGLMVTAIGTLLGLLGAVALSRLHGVTGLRRERARPDGDRRRGGVHGGRRGVCGLLAGASGDVGRAEHGIAVGKSGGSRDIRRRHGQYEVRQLLRFRFQVSGAKAFTLIPETSY